MFSPFPARIGGSQAFQVYLIVDGSQIPDLAAGHLQALESKPGQVVVLCYRFAQSL